eukprot:CAMPEP_0117424542 /NCGR_PEP_ID=MMETSP0758-20121206/4935_1 /TAXON_ID=63605 /ORGANISM="Percolomonas cosmopolitus, Strain AE-1 (ATCC 50343)" /LENGTH=395 /DNA_ID=CAMNT_0005208373 /DNA_START=932 /DNA_END=2116 /DNA_ORIENTATION=-
MKINPRHIDVNVHPSKEEVHLQNEEEIMNLIKNEIHDNMLLSNHERSFNTISTTQQILPFASPQKSKSTPDTQKVYDYQKVRSTRSDQQGDLEKYIQITSSEKRPRPETFIPENQTPIKKKKIQEQPHEVIMEDDEEEEELISVHTLIEECRANSCKELTTLMKKQTYVGYVHPQLSCIQFKTNLYAVNPIRISKPLFYQAIIKKFGKMGRIEFHSPVPIKPLIQAAVKLPEHTVDEYCQFLLSRTDMLNEYFSLHFIMKESEIQLQCLPQILNNHVPSLHRLPPFLVEMVEEVNWQDEKECFESIANVLSTFYALPDEHELHKEKDVPESSVVMTDDAPKNVEKSFYSGLYTEESLKWITQHVLFESARWLLDVPQELLNDQSTFLQIADLNDL